MGVVSINEFNKNISAVLQRAEGGEEIVLTRHGKEILCLSKSALREAKARELERQEAAESLIKLLKKGLNFGGPATYEERTGSDRFDKWD